MTQLGMGVMINMLCGNEETVEIVNDSIGKKIAEVKLEDDTLKFKFSDGSTMNLRDEGQSCCEHRYMSLDGDKDLSYFVGHKLKALELASAEAKDLEYGDVHEVQFLHVKTNKGTFTVSNHNEHNGYYGGFSLVATR